MKQNKCPWCKKKFAQKDWYRRLGTCYPCGDALQKAQKEFNRISK